MKKRLFHWCILHHHDPALAGDLALRPPQGVLDQVYMLRFGIDLDDGLTLLDLRGQADRLAERMRHARAHTVGSRTGGQWILPKNMMRIDAHTHMVTSLAKHFLQQSVAGLPGSFKRVVPDLQAVSRHKRHGYREGLAQLPHLIAHDLAHDAAFHESLLAEFGAPRVCPFYLAVGYAFADFYHTELEKGFVFKGCGQENGLWSWVRSREYSEPPNL